MTDGPLVFPVTIELPVQWGEMDAFGHVNNVTYLRWFESARIAYFERSKIMAAMPRVGPIMARQSINYRLPLHYPDQLLVSCGVTSIGRSSFQLAMRLRSRAHGRAIAAEGDAVIVMFDYEAKKAAQVSDALRASIEALQASAPRAGAPDADA
jgi:acyl-CoA thioester hydrolase